MLTVVRLVPIVLLALALPALAANEPAEQSVTPIVPRVEQRVDPIGQPSEQHVEALSPEAAQQVQGTAPHGAVHRVADGIVKAGVVVLGTAIAIGTTLASLLFL